MSKKSKITLTVKDSKEVLTLLDYKAEETITVEKHGSILIIPQSNTTKKEVKEHYSKIYDKDKLLILYPKQIKKQNYEVSKQLGTRTIIKTIITGLHELSIDDMKFVMANTVSRKCTVPDTVKII